MKDHESLLGLFRVPSQELTVSDPAYMVGSEGQLYLTPVRPGSWRATFDGTTLRTEYEGEDYQQFSTECEVYAESGFLGVYDAVAFRHPLLVPAPWCADNPPEHRWAAMHADVKEPKVLPFGAVIVVPKGLAKFRVSVFKSRSGIVNRIDVRMV